MEKKKRIWIIVLMVLLSLGVAVAFYWDVLVMYAAPQIPIRQALERAFLSLEQRFQESPGAVILGAYDDEGKNTFSVELRDPEGILPRRTMEIQADLLDPQLLFRGALPDDPRLGNVELFMGPDFFSIRSDALLGGGCYGITYDTFRQDILSIPLVKIAMPDALVDQWADSLDQLQKKMDWKVTLPHIPEVSVEDVRTAALGLWILRGRVTTQELMVGSQSLTCWKVRYQLDGKAACSLYEAVTGKSASKDQQIRLVFYLHQRSLVGLEFEASAGRPQLTASAFLGLDPMTDDLSLNTAGRAGEFHASVTSRQGRKTLRINDFRCDYDWDRQSGDLLLLLPGREPVPMKLKNIQNGFQAESPQLWSLIRNDPQVRDACTIRVTKGAEIQWPQYKNLDQWSLNDLLVLLSGIWGIIKP